MHCDSILGRASRSPRSPVGLQHLQLERSLVLQRPQDDARAVELEIVPSLPSPVSIQGLHCFHLGGVSSAAVARSSAGLPPHVLELTSQAPVFMSANGEHDARLLRDCAAGAWMLRDVEQKGAVAFEVAAQEAWPATQPLSRNAGGVQQPKVKVLRGPELSHDVVQRGVGKDEPAWVRPAAVSGDGSSHHWGRLQWRPGDHLCRAPSLASRLQMEAPCDEPLVQTHALVRQRLDPKSASCHEACRSSAWPSWPIDLTSRPLGGPLS